MSFWKYLIKNVWLYVGFLIFVGGFIAYWYATSGWIEEIKWTIIGASVIGLILIVGNYITYRKIKK